ncbi:MULTISPECIES: DUF6074 family protein [unclassified Rhizobium]|uniref:DUF6074 family protein n=1 Tax=unclassified Rhizobium TaxID=2613769 RepID=UPI001ADBBF92|nr:MULTISPECIES: DUF6074 family protein [unclassified Rhizobium]MBO9122788.1 hypothetical protein [Rhizobium sp. 16-488-2b]MBO9173320.1 hypothetical protein [Rhizobium sp. 16-488-2a]
MFDILDQQLARASSPVSAVYHFPVEREVGLIRETARILEKRTGSAADRFWQMTCRRLYARYQVNGMAELQIKEALATFTYAVHAEMARAAWDEWTGDNPRGAA